MRTTVFLKGCPIRCRWCANPESQNSAFELAYLKEEILPLVNTVICDMKAMGDGKHSPFTGVSNAFDPEEFGQASPNGPGPAGEDAVDTRCKRRRIHPCGLGGFLAGP